MDGFLSFFLLLVWGAFYAAPLESEFLIRGLYETNETAPLDPV
jgi:hypothetical protein